MDYNQFVERIKTDTKVKLFDDDKKGSYIIISWILRDEIEPNFTEFDDIVFLFRSDINVLRFNKLKQVLICCGVEKRLDCCIATKRCYLKDIYRVFIKNCFITAKCFLCKERAITAIQNNPICWGCFEKANDETKIPIAINEEKIESKTISALKKYYIDKKIIDLSFVLSIEEINALKNADQGTPNALQSCIERGYLTAELRPSPLGKLLRDKILSDDAIESLASLSQNEE